MKMLPVANGCVRDDQSIIQDAAIVSHRQKVFFVSVYRGFFEQKTRIDLFFIHFPGFV